MGEETGNFCVLEKNLQNCKNRGFIGFIGFIIKIKK